MNTPPYTLGLDLGSKSIGWALIDDAGQKIINAGVRIFPECVDPKANVPNNQKRRRARGMRRQIARRAHRIKNLRQALIAAGLLPQVASLAPNHAERVKWESEEFEKENPYALRRRALDEPLAPFDFGRAVLHLGKRRGFKSNRKTGQVIHLSGAKTERPKKEEKERRKQIDPKAAMRQLHESMREHGSRTIGEHLFRIGNGDISLPQSIHVGIDDRHRVRGRYTLRSMFEVEFEILWQEQQKHISILNSEGLKDKLHRIIFFQRPLRSSKHLIGRCECTGQRRCPRSDWHSQQFRLLKETNNLCIHNSDGSEQQLTPDQRRMLYSTLGKREKMTFEEMRDLLGLYESQVFNLEEGPRENGAKGKPRRAGAGKAPTKRASLKGNTIEAALDKTFGKRWDEMPEERRMHIRNAVTEIEDPEKLFAIATKEWSLSENNANELVNLPLPDGYPAYSLEAMKNMIKKFEEALEKREGIKEYDARELCGYNKFTQVPVCDFLPPPEKRDKKPLVNNPIVRQALYEIRKLVNAIIRTYGKPAKIVVEMIREMKGSLAKRTELVEIQEANRKEKEEIREILKKEFAKADASGTDVLAYRLWKQQGWVSPYSADTKAESPYSGRAISKAHMQAFFDGKGVLHVDHILPYSKTLDNSQNNKCLCFAEENDEKRNRTPRQWLGEETEQYKAMLQRVAGMKETGMPWNKRRRFSQKEICLDDFVNRQLNDTAYMAREVRRYLQCLYSGDKYERDQRVVCTRGQVTGELRWHWGLDSILDPDGRAEKNRLDLRHHAIDAIVVALTTFQRLYALSQSQTWRRSDSAKREPWPGFRSDVEKAVLAINVSHRVKRKVKGKLHDDTIYGPTSEQNKFVYRKPLDGLKVSMIHNICDLQVKRLVVERLKEYGIEVTKNKSKHVEDEDGDDEKEVKIPKSVWEKPLMMSRKQGRVTTKAAVIKKVRLFKKDETIRAIRGGTIFVKPGSTHHLVLFEFGNQKGETEWDADFVDMLTASKRLKVNQPVIQKDIGVPPGARFKMSLSSGEMVLLNIKGKRELYRFETAPSTTKQMTFRKHCAAAVGSNGKLTKYPGSLKKLDPRKVTVDPIGHIRWAND
jgi:CRISPR-associated endonuclease Csn1